MLLPLLLNAAVLSSIMNAALAAAAAAGAPNYNQIIAVSATFTEEMLRELRSWMSDPQQVMLCEETVSLKVMLRGAHQPAAAAG